LFGYYGKIEKMHLMREQDGTSKGCAFVKYENKEHALLAIRDLNSQAYICHAKNPL